MGNYKFRLADMMPNAWFYKLRDMSNKPRTQKHHQQPPLDPKITTTKKTNKKTKSAATFHNSSSSPPSSPSTTATAATATTTTTTTTASSNPNPACLQRSPRKSYYFTRDHPANSSPPDNPRPLRAPAKSFPDSPRRSSSKAAATTRRKRRPSSTRQHQKQLSSAASAQTESVSGAATLDSVWSTGLHSPSEYSSSCSEEEYSDGRESRYDRILNTACSCQEGEKSKEAKTAAASRPEAKAKPVPEKEEFDSFAKLELPPIATKPKKKDKTTSKTKTFDSINSLARKTSNNSNTTGSPGIRLRINNSPRIANRRVSGARKSVSSSSSSSSKKKSGLSESFAIVKSSFDPQRDFRESMVEMIVENNLRGSKDMEDLLACYLSLNSDEYHGLIIKVFKQIWFDLTNIS